MHSKPPTIAHIALPIPLRKSFDYLLPEHFQIPERGCRIDVPFGSRNLIGIVLSCDSHSDYPIEKLKVVNEIIDQDPIIPPSLWDLLLWCKDYYHHSIGEIFSTALPNALMQGKPAEIVREKIWQATETGLSQWQASLTNRAIKLRKVMQSLADNPNGMQDEHLKSLDITSSHLKKLVERHWIKECSAALPISLPTLKRVTSDHQLNAEQSKSITSVTAAIGKFQPFLLDGVTGSGKTEVYLSIIESVIQHNKTALVLIPEIGLTPQTLERFEKRFPRQVGFLHSGLTDKNRLQTWLKAKENQLSIIIGTRSALFTPLENLGVIIVDEEHDQSFKQQDGFRYSSRDLAVVRGQFEKCPVVLGTATPSLESLNNAIDGRYQWLTLSQRATQSQLPKIKIIDCRDQPMVCGLGQPLLAAMKKHLDRGNQVLVFINRRGFAPVLMCHRCGWIAECKRCERTMTLHSLQRDPGKNYLQCHHCGQTKNTPKACKECHHSPLVALGQGTERIEQALLNQFPNIPLQRIDRDTTRRKNAMSEYVEAAQSGKTQLLIGTQMLAKGHHFPNVTLVAILNMDGALFSSDFRAPEKAAQLITQVAGRAGRADKPGEVFIQTHHPEHPLLHAITSSNYRECALPLLNDRKTALLPPVSFMAIIRAESTDKDLAKSFLAEAAKILSTASRENETIGPLPCTITKKSGRFRFQLIINSVKRSLLQKQLFLALNEIESLPLSKKVRWSLDIDPQDML